MTGRPPTRLALTAVPALIGAAIAVGLRGHPGPDRAAVLATGAYLVLVLVAGIRRMLPGHRPPPPPPAGESVRPLAQLTSVETSVALSHSSALEYEHRLQRDLRYAAGERLRLRRGIDLQQRPDEARTVLGERAWQMLTQRSAWDDRMAPAPTLAAIAALIETLEGV